MPGSKEIRTKIKSVQNTRKITKAMEMVAASKMRKAQERTRTARPYADKIRNVAAHLSHANPEYRHPYLVTRDTAKKIGIIVVTADKGLCGGLNTNVLRMALARMREWESQGETFEVCCIGNKGLGFMQRLGANVVRFDVFPDHHAYTPDELAALQAAAAGAGAKMLVTTGKDYVKWQPMLEGGRAQGPPVAAIEIALAVTHGEDTLRQRLAGIMHV